METSLDLSSVCKRLFVEFEVNENILVLGERNCTIDDDDDVLENVPDDESDMYSTGDVVDWFSDFSLLILVYGCRFLGVALDSVNAFWFLGSFERVDCRQLEQHNSCWRPNRCLIKDL